MKKIQQYLILSRPKQWIKNLFVLAGFVFAGRYNDYSLLILSVSATLLFCIGSSAVYVFNDCIDAGKDKFHPVKKFRPVANGSISVREGMTLSFILSVVPVVLSFCISLKFSVILSLYLLLNVLYSLRFKNIVILDVFCIALGFILRMLAGTYALLIPPSEWIIICTLMISLFLGFCKRYAELKAFRKEGRRVLSNYGKFYLLLMLGISSSCTIMSYGLYTINDRTILTHGTNKLIYSLPIVIFGLFRYLYIVLNDNKGEDPSRQILEDRQIRITAFLYIISILLIIKIG